MADQCRLPNVRMRCIPIPLMNATEAVTRRSTIASEQPNPPTSTTDVDPGARLRTRPVGWLRRA